MGLTDFWKSDFNFEPKLRTYLVILAAVAVIPASGANLLLTNPNFQDGGGPYEFNIGTYTATPGWIATVTTAGGGSFIGTNDDQFGAGQRFAYTRGDSGFWETATVNRAEVAAGSAYSFNYSARNDGFVATAFVLVQWFNTGGTLISSSTDFASDFAPTSTTAGAALGNYSHTVTAPVGATAAGVRWGTTSGGMLGDNFFLDVVPEPSSAMLGALGIMTLLIRRRRA